MERITANPPLSFAGQLLGMKEGGRQGESVCLDLLHHCWPMQFRWALERLLSTGEKWLCEVSAADGRLPDLHTLEAAPLNAEPMLIRGSELASSKHCHMAISHQLNGLAGEIKGTTGRLPDANIGTKGIFTHVRRLAVLDRLHILLSTSQLRQEKRSYACRSSGAYVASCTANA